MLPLSLTKRVGFSLVIYKRDQILLIVICDFFDQICELSNTWNGLKLLSYDMLFIVCRMQLLWLFSIYFFYNWYYRVRVLKVNSRDWKVCILFKVFSLSILILHFVFYDYVGDFDLCTFLVLMKIIRSYIMQQNCMSFFPNYCMVSEHNYV